MHCPVLQGLLDAIAEAAQMAQVKREYLDIEPVCPEPLAEFDSERCEIRQAVQTDDPDMHKRVERTLVPGRRYRGAVLRRAKVSIYRHVEREQ
jgi:molecular chaperone GrpE (heat shock protein)